MRSKVPNRPMLEGPLSAKSGQWAHCSRRPSVDRREGKLYYSRPTIFMVASKAP